MSDRWRGRDRSRRRWPRTAAWDAWPRVGSSSSLRHSNAQGAGAPARDPASEGDCGERTRRFLGKWTATPKEGFGPGRRPQVRGDREGLTKRNGKEQSLKVSKVS